MADFYPILSRAIAGLPDKSPEARRAVYDRARSALVAQLRGLDPPLGEAEIMRERLALDEAVSRVEADFDENSLAAAPPTLPVRPAPVQDAPAPEAPPRAPAGHEERDFGRFDDEPAEQPEPAEPAVIRPRVAPPRERRVDPGHIRTIIVGSGVAVAVAAIAATAIYLKYNPPEAPPRPRVETPVQPAQPDAAGKINDRIGEAPAPTQPPRNGAGSAPAPVQHPGGEVAVAQRAILYTEDPNSPQQPQAVNGRVFWRLDSESAGQGRPVETIVRATIEVPDAGLSLDFTIRRNADNAFPASHIIGMRFTRSGAQASDAVREVGVPQFKTEENERGAPISAISSALGENLFVAALSNVPVELQRNLELMQDRPWIDIPLRFASGRRGIITFEKGVSGSQTLGDALNRWR